MDGKFYQRTRRDNGAVHNMSARVLNIYHNPLKFRPAVIVIGQLKPTIAHMGSFKIEETKICRMGCVVRTFGGHGMVENISETGYEDHRRPAVLC